MLIGDGGVAYRSSGSRQVVQEGRSRRRCATSRTARGSRLAVRGRRRLEQRRPVLRSDDEGKSWKKVKLKADSKLWGITSWGDGAFLGGDGGVYTLMSPKDTYWKGTKDRFAPQPPKVDAQFTPIAARSEKDREAKFGKLLAAAIADHTRISAKQRSQRSGRRQRELAAGGRRRCRGCRGGLRGLAAKTPAIRAASSRRSSCGSRRIRRTRSSRRPRRRC